MNLDFKPLFDVGHGPPIILLHGLFGNLSNWSHVAHEFTATNRVLVLRLPLYSKPISSQRLNDLVIYLQHFIEDHKLDKVILMGNSLGGHIALLYTWQNSDRVQKLILTGSSGLYEYSFGGSFPRVKDYEYIRAKIGDTFYKQEIVTKQLVDEVYATVQSPLKTLSLIRLARAAQKNNVSHILDQINVPTLLIWGLQDTITPPEVALEFHRLLPYSDVVFLDHCGHVPMMEQPRLFNEHVRKFLEH